MQTCPNLHVGIDAGAHAHVSAICMRGHMYEERPAKEQFKMV